MNLSLVIMNPEKITEINNIVIRYAFNNMTTSSHVYFDRQPINPNQIIEDIIFFKLISENESGVKKKLNDLIKELDEVKTDYYIRDEKTGLLIVKIDFAGTITIGFDNIKIINEGTFKRIDELKLLKTEFGYCKGFRPSFRPVESKSIEGTIVKPELIYLFSDSSENLSKLKEFMCEKIMEIDSNFKVEFETFTY